MQAQNMSRKRERENRKSVTLQINPESDQSYSIVSKYTAFYLIAETTIHVSSFLCCFVLYCIVLYIRYGTDTYIFFVGPIQ